MIILTETVILPVEAEIAIMTKEGTREITALVVGDFAAHPYITGADPITFDESEWAVTHIHTGFKLPVYSICEESARSIIFALSAMTLLTAADVNNAKDTVMEIVRLAK